MKRFVRWVLAKRRIRVRSTFFWGIGNSAEEIYFAGLRAQEECSRVFWVYPKGRLLGRFMTGISNETMFQLRSSYLVPNDNFLGGLINFSFGLRFTLASILHLPWSQGKVHRVLRTVFRNMSDKARFSPQSGFPVIGRNSLWAPEHTDEFSWSVVAEQDWPRKFRDYIPPTLSDSKRRQASQRRLAMGIPLQDWFVCLHVRENTGGIRYRNATIANYVDAMKSITNAGGWVVRIGDDNMTPLPEMARVLDYARSPNKSSMMDMYFLEECRFFLGQNSGPSDVAALFAKPTVLVNLTEWTLGFPILHGGLALPRHVFSTEKGRYLSIQELLDAPFSWQSISLPNPDYLLFENTPQEIKEVVEELLTRTEPVAYTTLQQEFVGRRKNQITDGVNTGGLMTANPLVRMPVVEQYRIASRVSSLGTLGHRYLEQNWEIDGFQEAAPGPVLEDNSATNP